MQGASVSESISAASGNECSFRFRAPYDFKKQTSPSAPTATPRLSGVFPGSMSPSSFKVKASTNLGIEKLTNPKADICLDRAVGYAPQLFHLIAESTIANQIPP